MARSRGASFAGTEAVPLSAEARTARSSANTPEGYRPITGRKSGRVAPLTPLRQPAREATLVAHGLMEPGKGDTNQGQLFSTKQFEKPVSQVASEAGVAPPLASSAGGFLPGITASPTGAVSAHQRKVNAIQSFAETRAEHPIDVPHLTPAGDEYGEGARHMAHIQKLGEAAPKSPWYTDRDPDTGHVTEGRAIEGVRTAAAKTDSTMPAMTRAVAQTSPQTPWTSGNANSPGFPNLETATNVGRSVREREARNPGVKARESTLERLGRESPGVGLSLSKERAAVSLGRPETASTPLPAKTEGMEKVPNFNENLSMGQEQVPTAVRAEYAGAYTSDMHDLAAKNLPETLHKTKGQYDMDKMLSARVAFKNRVLPGHLQSGVWSKQRDPEPLSTAVAPRGCCVRTSSAASWSRASTSPRSSEGAVPDRHRSEAAKRANTDF